MIKKYSTFINESKMKVEIEKIEHLCNYYNIKDFHINEDGTVDVYGDVLLNNLPGGLDKLPVKFGEVTGDFNCGHNQLTTLEGSPHTVGGMFSCYKNQITSMEGGPSSVGSRYEVGNNSIKSFKGFPENMVIIYGLGLKVIP
jgi:hypothetical protein